MFNFRQFQCFTNLHLYKKIAKILNIKLINLPPYSPTLKSYRTTMENNEKYNSQRILKIQRTSKRTSQKNLQ